MTTRRFEIDHVEADSVLAHDAQIGQRIEHGFVERLEPGDGFRMAAQESDQRIAAERPARLVEGRSRIAGQQLLSQSLALRERMRRHSNLGPHGGTAHVRSFAIPSVSL